LLAPVILEPVRRLFPVALTSASERGDRSGLVTGD